MFDIMEPAPRTILEILAAGSRARRALEAECQRRNSDMGDWSLATLPTVIAALIDLDLVINMPSNEGGLLILTTEGAQQLAALG
jgi:hypothetical protein